MSNRVSKYVSGLFVLLLLVWMTKKKGKMIGKWMLTSLVNKWSYDLENRHLNMNFFKSPKVYPQVNFIF